jgi:hypothetical protein
LSEELTGHDFVEANHGLKPAPTEPTPAESETFGPGIQGVMDAGNSLTRERGGSTEQEPIERHLEWKSGEKRGQRVDMKAERFSLSPESAAQTLTEVHKAEAEMELRPQLENLAAEVDLARYQVAAGATGHAEAPVADASPSQPDAAQSESPQPEYGEQPSGLDPEVSAALQNPKVRAVIEAAVAPAEQARQQYVGATAQVAGMLVAELCADLPEIASLPPEQRLVGLQILQKQQPERFAALEARAGRIQQVVNAQAQNAAVEAQQHRQAFQNWSKAQDKALEAKVPEIANDPDMRVSKAALKTLKDAGYDESELAAAWNGVPFSMRDHRAQLLIWKASRFDQIQATAHANPARQLPAVQRPGVAPSPGDRAAVDLSGLRNQLKNATGLEAVRIATKLHQAQRAARSR